MEPAVVSFNRKGHGHGTAYHYQQKRKTLEPSVVKVDAASNLFRFLEHTTPRVTSQFLPKTQLRGLCYRESEVWENRFFSLSDLWNSFDEWSAYGAGVPIVLNGKETVTQYYVPYLSAIQLYSVADRSLGFKNRGQLGDDSDGSEMDYRDSNSEISTSDGEQERLSDDTTWDGGEQNHQRESLLFEFFESAAPSHRVPLFDKVRDLATRFPGIKTLSSNELSPSSWLSVAWYPIYRIPTGPTLKDLAACFLTYHSLSTLSSEVYCEEQGVHSPCGTLVSLHPFAFAGYKFRGPVWSSSGVAERQRAALLHKSSHDWLKRLRVCHPDYEYFMSHCSPSRH